MASLTCVVVIYPTGDGNKIGIKGFNKLFREVTAVGTRVHAVLEEKGSTIKIYRYMISKKRKKYFRKKSMKAPILQAAKTTNQSSGLMNTRPKHVVYYKMLEKLIVK